ncbi:MAG: phosphotransferase-like protein, partial [Stackebrandtia sp.]
GDDGGVDVGPEFAAADAAWRAGLAQMSRHGARLIIDEVLLSGVVGQRRWQAVLTGIETLWVGVRCDVSVAARREARRADRIVGMAASQAELVHDGIDYDLVVDTTYRSAAEVAAGIARSV